MTTDIYPAERTGILLLDPYNDYMSQGGKLYDGIKDVAKSVNAFDNMKKIVAAARQAGIQIFVLPHHHWHDGDFDHFEHLNESHRRTRELQLFAAGSWGGDWHPDFVPKKGDVMVKEHWLHSGFANTDLDEQLKQHDVANIICIGMMANTCIEATARYGMEFGYHVTLVRDATAALSADAMKSAHDVNAPLYAHAVVTTDELLRQLPKAKAAA